MIVLALALAASTLVAADPAASPAGPVTAPVVAKPADDLDRVTCRSDPQTGTRLAVHKECHTKRDWRQMQIDNSNMLNHATTSVTMGQPPR